MSERTIVTPELLAPVGGREQLVAAVNNGADAVYMGGSLFNARMKADNFSADAAAEGEDLKWAIDYAHSRGVKVYITFNTLIRDSELPKAFRYACSLYEMGADAVILQDMGLSRLIHKYLPDFPMHLSTQGTVYNRSGVEFAEQMGFARVVPARECSLEEIGSMCQARAEIEVFVHGALCMCYSGQCQMSRLLGGGAGSKSGGTKGGSARSGNRGLCAQPCRLLYTDDRGRKGYFLSPKDICTLDELPALCEAGVDSFKIEGRLKSPEYVAIVTGIYRKYLDIYSNTDEKTRSAFVKHPEKWSDIIADEDRKNLKQIFNRGGFTRGYLHGNPEEKILSGRSPKNQGIPVGKVTAIKPVKAGKKSSEKRWLADVKLFKGATLSMGDGVELEQCGNVITYLEKGPGGTLRIGDFKTDSKTPIKAGETVYKVTDRKLCEAALKQARQKKTEIQMKFQGLVGRQAELQILADGKTYSAKAETPVEKALRRPADPQRIREQLSRLGDTPFEAGNVEISVDNDAMIPVSVINSLRRQTAQMALTDRCWSREPVSETVIEGALEEIRKSSDLPGGRFACLPEGSAPLENIQNEAVLVPLEVFMEKHGAAGACDAAEMAGVADAAGTAGADGTVGAIEIPYILNVSKGNLDDYIEANFDEICRAVSRCGIAAGNPGWIRQFQEAGIKVYGDYGLNVFNGQAVAAFAEAGVDVIEWSDEKSDRRCRREPEIMGNIPMMITEHPLRSDYLIDRKGVKHEIMKWYSGDKFLIF